MATVSSTRGGSFAAAPLFVHRSPRNQPTVQCPPFSYRSALHDGRNRLDRIARDDVDAARARVADGEQTIPRLQRGRPPHVARIAACASRSWSPLPDWLAPLCCKYASIQLQVVVYHPFCRKPALHVRTCSATIQFSYLVDRRHGAIEVTRWNQEAAHAVDDQLRHRTALESNDRRAGSHRLDHGQTKRLVEV